MARKLVALGLLATVGVAPASAAQPGTVLVQASRALGTDQRAVSYADLPLASVSGTRQLRERVGHAIADLCDPSHFSVSDPHGSLKCSAQAWADITPQLTQLTASLASR